MSWELGPGSDRLHRRVAYLRVCAPDGVFAPAQGRDTGFPDQCDSCHLLNSENTGGEFVPDVVHN